MNLSAFEEAGEAGSDAVRDRSGDGADPLSMTSIRSGAIGYGVGDDCHGVLRRALLCSSGACRA